MSSGLRGCASELVILFLFTTWLFPTLVRLPVKDTALLRGALAQSPFVFRSRSVLSITVVLGHRAWLVLRVVHTVVLRVLGLLRPLRLLTAATIAAVTLLVMSAFDLQIGLSDPKPKGVTVL